MDLNSTKHAPSSGRLPERPNGAQREASPAIQTDKTDAVKQDQMWKDHVWLERKTARAWERKLGFPKTHEYMRLPINEKSPLSNVSLCIDHVPNTSNKVYGSRLSTPLGKEVIRLDRSTLWSQTLRWKFKKTSSEALLF